MPQSDQEYPTPVQRQLIWTGLSAFFAVLLGAIAVGAVVLVSWVLGYLQPILVPVAVAGILAYLLQPVVGWVRRTRGWDRHRAVYTVYFTFLTAGVLLGFMVLYPTIKQARQFSSDYLSVETTEVQPGDGDGNGVGAADSQPSSKLAQTKLGRSTIEWLQKLDRSVGQHLAGLAPVQRFRNVEEETWDIGEIVTWLWAQLSGFLDEAAQFFSRGLSSATSLLGYFFGLFLVPIYLFFFLRESASISRTWTDYIPLRKSRLKDEVAETLREVNQYIIAYFRGQMVVSIIDAVLVTIALSLIGLPYALLLGVLLAVLGLIPYLGSLLVMIPAAVIALVHFGATASGTPAEGAAAGALSIGEKATIATSAEETVQGVVSKVSEDGQTVEVLLHAWSWLPHVWVYPLIVLGFFVVLQQINGLVTAPKIVGDSVGLHPLTVIFSMLFWALLLGGLLGALLAVPLTASVKVLFRRYIWVRKLHPQTAAQEDPPGGGDRAATGRDETGPEEQPSDELES